ncbi:MAG: complex I subunit 1 family protein, partial [Deltaproteobacteria bacterium]
VAMGAALVGPLMIYETFSLKEMVFRQEAIWGIFLQPLAFVIVLIAAFAECNRLPFDLPEGEAEIVAGYHTEYGSMKFAIFFMAEYLHVVTICSLIATLFLGGWHLIPGMVTVAEWVGIPTFPTSVGLSLLQVASFCIKTAFMIWIFIWVRWTFPRFRYDQLMSFGWKIMVPLGLVNILLTTVALYFKWI